MKLFPSIAVAAAILSGSLPATANQLPESLSLAYQGLGMTHMANLYINEGNWHAACDVYNDKKILIANPSYKSSPKEINFINKGAKAACKLAGKTWTPISTTEKFSISDLPPLPQ